MKISQYAINRITPILVGHKTGKEIINFFENYGIRDVYDENGLPDIGKANEQRPSKTEYVRKRLADLNDSYILRQLFIDFLNENIALVPAFNSILNPENFSIVLVNEVCVIEGGVVDNSDPIINEAHFQDIQNRILIALDNALVSITIVMAWFTNDTLFQKIVEKQKQGIEVKLAIYDDGINKKHGVDISQVPHIKLQKGVRGGLMHNKFCIIDNQVVITGSYNWSENAEFKNDENVTIEYDPKLASKYSVEYRRLTS